MAIETATEVCSVALFSDMECLAVRESADQRSHTRSCTQYISDVLDQQDLHISDLDAVALSIGPGSYTGLRVGASIAKGICYGAGLPLITMSALDSLAYASANVVPGTKHLHVPMIDARRMEVYTAFYTTDGAMIEAPHALILAPGQFDAYLQDQYDGIVYSGNGAGKYREWASGAQHLFPDIACSARYMGKIATDKYHKSDYTDIAYFKPLYIKPPHITSSKKKLF